MQPLYDPEGVRPMWEELAQCGVEPVQTRENVDECQRRPKTAHSWRVKIAHPTIG